MIKSKDTALQDHRKEPSLPVAIKSDKLPVNLPLCTMTPPIQKRRAKKGDGNSFAAPETQWLILMEMLDHQILRKEEIKRQRKRWNRMESFLEEQQMLMPTIQMIAAYLQIILTNRLIWRRLSLLLIMEWALWSPIRKVNKLDLLECHLMESK